MRKQRYRIENRRLSKAWRASVVSPLQWHESQNKVGAKEGEAGGYVVQADGFPRTGYLKPAKPHQEAEKSARAAREKIASDLAQDLELPVPPAMLTIRENPPVNCEATVVVTLVMYPSQYTWGQVKTLVLGADPGGLALASVYSQCSPVLPFDAWVQQADHGDHPDNIIWGYDPSNITDSQLIFLDYAYSLGYDGRWGGEGWKQFALPPFPPALLEHGDEIKLLETAHRIAAFDREEIRDIVYRIPKAYLEDAQKDTICTGLIGRRSLVLASIEAKLDELQIGA